MLFGDEMQQNSELFNDDASHIEHAQEEFMDDPEKERQKMEDMINKIVEKQEYYEVAQREIEN